MGDRIRQVELNTASLKNFKSQYVSCLILTKENKLLLQERDEHSYRYPGYLSTFGGKVESNEPPGEALVRELHEELGAKLIISDAIFIGAISEAMTNYTDLIYTYFWHDKHGSITGCYEYEPCYFNSGASILQSQYKLVDDIVWIIEQCLTRKLII